jgi:enoyl-CoA hydratase
VGDILRKLATEHTEITEKKSLRREMSDTLNIECRQKTVIVRFTRPEIRNPLSVDVLSELDNLVASCERNKNISSVIFTGTGDVFASGADLREIAAVKADTAVEFALRGQSLMAKIAALPQMTIAAINGYCFGGALDLVIACDRRIASPNAKFAHPGTGLGIITGWGGTQRLPRLVGQGLALELFFTAEPIDAHKAFSIGLIDEIVSDPLKHALGSVTE